MQILYLKNMTGLLNQTDVQNMKLNDLLNLCSKIIKLMPINESFQKDTSTNDDIYYIIFNDYLNKLNETLILRNELNDIKESLKKININKTQVGYLNNLFVVIHQILIYTSNINYKRIKIN